MKTIHNKPRTSEQRVLDDQASMLKQLQFAIRQQLTKVLFNILQSLVGQQVMLIHQSTGEPIHGRLYYAKKTGHFSVRRYRIKPAQVISWDIALDAKDLHIIFFQTSK